MVPLIASPNVTPAHRAMPPDDFVPLPLNTADPDAWDDSALIAAYDAAVSSHRTAGKQSPKTTEAAERPLRKRPLPTTPKREPPLKRPAVSTALSIPPPPPVQDDPELSALLAAYYEAGYRTGLYVARQQN